MGTRADFYKGRGEKAEWLGSIAWDGYPEGLPKKLLKSKTLKEFKENLKSFLDGRDDATLPADGWPWPWNDSELTDYAYAFERGKVYACPFGYGWFIATEDEPNGEDNPNFFEGKKAIFPDMRNIKKVKLGRKSGLIIIQRKSDAH